MGPLSELQQNKLQGLLQGHETQTSCTCFFRILTRRHVKIQIARVYPRSPEQTLQGEVWSSVIL